VKSSYKVVAAVAKEPQENVTTAQAVWDAATLYKDLPTSDVKASDLGQLATILRTRLRKELDVYFPKPNDKQCLALACDPVMATVGIPFLVQAGHGDIVLRAKALLHQELIGIIKGSNDAYVEPSEANAAPATEGSDDDDDDYFESVMGGIVLRSIVSSTECSSTSEELAIAASDAWFSQGYDWSSFLHGQQKVQGVEEGAVKKGNCIYLASVVDILLWWRLHAGQHPLVAQVAAVALATPVANGLQERVFSLCGRVESCLRQSLGKDKFQMLETLSFNKNFVSEIKLLKVSNTTKSLVSFYGLDDSLERDETETGLAIAQLVKDAATEATPEEDSDTNKRRRS